MKRYSSLTSAASSLVPPVSFSSFSLGVSFNLSEASGGRMRDGARMSVEEDWLSSQMQLPW